MIVKQQINNLTNQSIIWFQSTGPDAGGGKDWNMSGHSSADSDELSAEIQNRNNAETDDVHSLLSDFLRAKEETLEDMVGGLMSLTMGESLVCWWQLV